ncbi:MAG: hypothetical protein K2N03_00015 [Muribaculaceae bacterium]|nr:hypothetical protein [Muribaculaceae bacterium]
MKNFTSLVACGLMVMAASPAFAVTKDQTTLEKDGVTISYWNDFKDNITAADLNQLYPNMRVNVSGNDNFGVGTKGSINWTYEYTDGTIIKEGTNNGTIGNDKTFHTYIGLGVLPKNGDVEVRLTLTLTPAEGGEATEIEYAPFTFNYTKVVVPEDTPQAVFTWEVVPGDASANFVYKITTENVPEDATYRVWIDAPGNVTQGESTEKEGTITVPVPAGGQVTYWVKARVTLPSGTAFNATGNDTGVVFKANPLPADVPTFTLTCSNPQPVTKTSGTVDYTITGDLSKTSNVSMFVVTNVFGNGDVEVGRIDNVTANEGTIALTGLKPDVVNDIWVKMDVTLTDGTKLEQIQYPGAAQGWQGLSINTDSVSVTEIVTADTNVEYFNLQGVKVANPQNGLYIRVQGNKATKVLVK